MLSTPTLVEHPGRRDAIAQKLGSLYALLDRELASALAYMVSSITNAAHRPCPALEQAALLAAIVDAVRDLQAAVTDEVLGGRHLPKSEHELEMLRAAATALSEAVLSSPQSGVGTARITPTLT